MRIGTLAAAVLATATLLAPAAGQASIPPSYRILVVSPDDEARALAEALVQYMSAQGAFARVEPLVYRYQLTDCLAGDDYEGCARGLIPAQENWRDPPNLVVRADPAGDGSLELSCLGPDGEEGPRPMRRATVDVRQALFGEGEARTGQLRAAMACLQGL